MEPDERVELAMDCRQQPGSSSCVTVSCYMPVGARVGAVQAEGTFLPPPWIAKLRACESPSKSRTVPAGKHVEGKIIHVNVGKGGGNLSGSSALCMHVGGQVARSEMCLTREGFVQSSFRCLPIYFMTAVNVHTPLNAWAQVADWQLYLANG